MSPKPDPFDVAWDAPNTMHLDSPTIAVQPGAQGARLLFHHGGTTLAFALDPVQAATLAAALAPSARERAPSAGMAPGVSGADLQSGPDGGAQGPAQAGSEGPAQAGSEAGG